jgi:hypothetical protein
MLTEDKRKQLDTIVQKMVENGEKDSTIQFVVNDFKTKYDQPEPEPRGDGIVKSIVKGITNPILRLGATANALGTSKILGGKGANMQPQKVPYFGNIKPISNAKEAAGVAGQLAGLSIPNPIVSGAAFGAGVNLENNKNPLTGGLAGAAGGALIKGAGIALSKGLTKALPAVMEQTASIPSGAIERGMERPAQVGKMVNKNSESALSNIQQAVRGLRQTLSEKYATGKDQLVQQFAENRMGFNTNEIRVVNKVADNFGLDVQNPQNLSLNEALNLFKEVNELYSKPAIKISAEGIPVRQLREIMRTKIINTFGGTNGPVDQFLKDYGAQKAVHDAADDLVRAYKTGSPKTQASALSTIKSVFNENKSAYISALQDLEQATGTDILDHLAALHVQKVLPAKSGKFGVDELFRYLLFPLTSPRLVGLETRALGRLKNVAQKVGLEQELKYLLLTTLSQDTK